MSRSNGEVKCVFSVLWWLCLVLFFRRDILGNVSNNETKCQHAPFQAFSRENERFRGGKRRVAFLRTECSATEMQKPTISTNVFVCHPPSVASFREFKSPRLLQVSRIFRRVRPERRVFQRRRFSATLLIRGSSISNESG